MFSDATAFALAAFVKAQHEVHAAAVHGAPAELDEKEIKQSVRAIRDAIAASKRAPEVKNGSDGVVRPARAPAESDEESRRRVRASRDAAAALAVAKRGAMAAKRKGRGRCAHPGCDKRPSFAADPNTTGRSCKEHKAPGMTDLLNKRCTHPGCDKRASFGDPETDRAEFCSEHKAPGMPCVARSRWTRNSAACAGIGGDGSGAATSVSRNGSDGAKKRRSGSSSSGPSSKSRKPRKRSPQMELFVNFKLELHNEGV